MFELIFIAGALGLIFFKSKKVVAEVKKVTDDVKSQLSKMTRPQFYEKFTTDARLVDWQGIPWRFAMAQSDLESNHGTNSLTVKANNIFSLKVGSGWHNAGWNGDKQVSNKGEPGGDFRAYNTWIEAMKDYVHLLHFPIYSKALEAALSNDFKKFASAIKAAGYDSTSPTYAGDLVGIFTRIEG